MRCGSHEEHQIYDKTRTKAADFDGNEILRTGLTHIHPSKSQLSSSSQLLLFYFNSVFSFVLLRIDSFKFSVVFFSHCVAWTEMCSMLAAFRCTSVSRNISHHLFFLLLFFLVLCLSHCCYFRWKWCNFLTLFALTFSRFWAHRYPTSHFCRHWSSAVHKLLHRFWNNNSTWDLCHSVFCFVFFPCHSLAPVTGHLFHISSRANKLAGKNSDRVKDFVHLFFQSFFFRRSSSFSLISFFFVFNPIPFAVCECIFFPFTQFRFGQRRRFICGCNLHFAQEGLVKWIEFGWKRWTHGEWQRHSAGEERARIERIMIGKHAKMEIENENCIAAIIIANLTHHHLSRIHVSSHSNKTERNTNDDEQQM